MKYSERKKIMNRIVLRIKQAKIHKLQGGLSKYGMCMNIFYRNVGHFTAQSKDCL